MVQATKEPKTLHNAAKGATIVLADANISDLASIERILARHGYTVRSTHTSRNAVQTIEEISPDLIIIDVRLPETGGIEVCRHLKAQERFRDTPIIFVDDIEGTAEKSRAFKTGGADWIVKPVEKWELLAKIETHLKLFYMVKSFASQKNQGKPKGITDTERQLMKQRDRLEATVKKCTSQLTIAKEQSKAANITKNIFLSHMSHELRTPLNAILGFSRLMERDANLTEKQAEHLDLIHQSGVHLLNLINDVLAMAKTDAGIEALDMKVTDLPQFVERIAVMFKSRTVGRGLTFSLNMMPHMPRYVTCDERKLQQILTNLMANSLKHTQTGGIELKVWSPDYDSKTHNAVSNKNNGKIKLSFEVRDSGKGIETDRLKTIFDPFFSEPKDGAAKTGTGLGLTVSRNFARLMGGDITAANRRGKGARVTVHITVELASNPPEQVHYRIAGIDSAKIGKRILVVDDNDTSRLLLSELLHDVGFAVKEAEDGRKAVALFFEWRPHLIFMDIRMPLMDGIAATKMIKATEAGRHIPIIALTAHTIEEERQKIIAAGCDAFIRKPFEERELFEVMAKQLNLAFILKRARKTHPPPSQPGPHPSIEALAKLPPSVLEKIKQSSLVLDMEKTNACIDDILAENSTLGESLKSLATRFRYNDIFKLADQAIRFKK
jgi:signal transduction histidine kinase